MRDKVSQLHDISLSIAVFLQQCAGSAHNAVSMRAYVCRNTPPKIEATAAHWLWFMSGQWN